MTDLIVHTSYTTTSKPDDIDDPIIIYLNVVYVLAGLGGGILILTISVITMCIYFCLRLAKGKRQVITLTTAPPHNVYTMEDDHDEQPHRR